MKILINTDWLKFIKDLTPEKQNEIMLAILDYPNRDCSLSCWDVIKPELEKGKIAYFNRIKSLKQNTTVTEPSRAPSRANDGDRDKDKDKDIVKERIKIIKIDDRFGIEYQELFNQWINYRKQIKKPIKDCSLELAFIKFWRDCGQNVDIAKEVVMSSISNGWQGLFPEKLIKPQINQKILTEQKKEKELAELIEKSKRGEL